MKTFDFVLDEPIDYVVGGEVTSGSRITFYAPKPSQRKKVMKLKQIFFQALPKTSSTDVKPEKPSDNAADDDINGDAIIALVASSNADYAEFIELGRSLICDQNAKIDDVTYLTTVLVDKIDVDVLESMVGQYIANFIVKSALKSLGKS